MTGPATRTLRVVLLVAALAWLGPARSPGQAPTLPVPAHDPGSVRSTLGPIPGAGGNPFGMSPGTDPAFLGGRAGTATPRVPTSITVPGGAMAAPTPGITAPAPLKITDVALYGPLDVPAAAEEEGPPDGLTLDAALDRLLRENLALAARRYQVPAARADVLTAGLRANPILFADSQLVPYGRYSRDRPGGPTQYDLNLTHPVDYSGKRLARRAAAAAAADVQEALYQEAARVEVANLYVAFVDVLAARETVRYARASRAGLQRLVDVHEVLYRKADVTRADLNRIRGMYDAAGVALAAAEEAVRRQKRTLATLLNLPPDRADSLEVRGTIGDPAPPPPPAGELRRLALESRPDLVALRLGVRRAEAGVRLARANRFGDAYVLYQPYTFQDNTHVGAKSATSWALGLTVPVPVFNRNQGGVVRARLNLEQTIVEVDALERRIAAEVVEAERQYAVTRELVRVIERDLLPVARQSRDDTLRLFVAGELKVTAVETAEAQREYNQAVRQYRDALIRHRRGMLALNTAVGRRVLP